MALDGQKRRWRASPRTQHQAPRAGSCRARRRRERPPHQTSGRRGQVGYNPVGYHTGSIWPHDNALIAAGLKANRRGRWGEPGRRPAVHRILPPSGSRTCALLRVRSRACWGAGCLTRSPARRRPARRRSTSSTRCSACGANAAAPGASSCSARRSQSGGKSLTITWGSRSATIWSTCWSIAGTSAELLGRRGSIEVIIHV